MNSILIIIFLSLITLLPVIINQNIFLERGNDLTEFFWPIYFFVKQNILQNHIFPLWNNSILSGTPLLPDPQSPLFYPFNMLFLIMPIGLGFIVSLILHSIIGGIGMYLLGKMGFKWNKFASLSVAAFYITSPKLAGYIEAGHIGLINSFTWIPYVFLSTIMITRTKNLYWVILLSIALSFIFYNHIITFFIVLSSVIILFIILILKNLKIIYLLNFILALIVCFGLISITLIPQIEWTPNTTRFMLISNHDTYPRWQSKSEFIDSIIWPLQYIKQGPFQDSEKLIVLPLSILFLSVLGIWKLKFNYRLMISGLIIFLIFFSLNNISPIYNILLSQDWYSLLRVTTRVWFLLYLMLILLSGFILDKLSRSKTNLQLLIIFVLISITEQLFLFESKLLTKPTISSKAPEKIYQHLSNDKEIFRIYCTTSCLSQKKVAEYGLQTIEGYSTLVQDNYYRQMLQLTNSFWDYYSLVIPPLGITIFEKIKPDIKSLADYNVKYIISPYSIDDNRLIFLKKFDSYSVYRIKNFRPRAYFVDRFANYLAEAPIRLFSTNLIKVDTSLNYSSGIVLAEVYSKGWKSYLNGSVENAIQEKSDRLRYIDIKPDTKFVDFVYSPESYRIGKTITAITIGIIFLLIIAQTIINKKYGR